MSSMLRFTRENAHEAVKLIGHEVWFYTNFQLFENGPYPPSCRGTLADVRCDDTLPFVMSDGWAFPYVVATRYSVVERPI